jgi:hypothetical protein
MANTFIKLSTVTVGPSGASSIDFTSIPQNYTDLKLALSLRGSTSAVSVNSQISFNSNTSNFSQKYLAGTGSATASGAGVSRFVGDIVGASATASVFSNGEFYIPNYTSANNKSYSIDNVSENNATLAYQELIAGLWSNTSAITSISIACETGNFVQYSTATLYGIKSS